MPEAFSPEIARQLGHAGLRPLMRALSDAAIDTVPASSRRAAFETLDAWWTSSEEYAMMDRLTASLQRRP